MKCKLVLDKKFYLKILSVSASSLCLLLFSFLHNPQPFSHGLNFKASCHAKICLNLPKGQRDKENWKTCQQDKDPKDKGWERGDADGVLQPIHLPEQLSNSTGIKWWECEHRGHPDGGHEGGGRTSTKSSSNLCPWSILVWNKPISGAFKDPRGICPRKGPWWQILGGIEIRGQWQNGGQPTIGSTSQGIQIRKRSFRQKRRKARAWANHGRTGWIFWGKQLTAGFQGCREKVFSSFRTLQLCKTQVTDDWPDCLDFPPWWIHHYTLERTR